MQWPPLPPLVLVPVRVLLSLFVAIFSLTMAAQKVDSAPSSILLLSGRCLRRGSTKHAVADCKRPSKDSTTSPGNKGKGKNKNAALPKSSSQQTAGAKAKPKPDAKKKAAAKPKGKGKAKPKASTSSSSSTQAMHVLMWAEDQSMEVVDETLPSASHVDAWSYSACTFYATFTPAFHSSEPVDADGILPPILDTGATHCLLPLKWMTHEQAENCKKIHLKVASGATVRRWTKWWPAAQGPALL